MVGFDRGHSSAEFLDESGRVVAEVCLDQYSALYRLPDGSQCSMPQRLAWCQHCANFVAAEEVPTIEQIDRKLSLLRSGPDGFRRLAEAEGEWLPSRYTGDILAELTSRELERWEGLREWRIRRKSPPRCLDCASTDVWLLPEDPTETVHPLIGAKLRLECHSIGRMQRREYDAEGLRIRPIV